MKRLKIRMSLAQETLLLFPRCARAVQQETEGVAVPGREVQVRSERVVVESGHAPHEVVDDRGVRMAADLVALDPVEPHHLVGAETAEREDVGRIRLGDGQVRKPELAEAVVLHRPEHVPPREVQRFDGPVPLFAPFPKRGERIRGVAERGVVAVVLVVRLPGDDVRVRSIAFGEPAGDSTALLPVALVTEAVVAARAESAHLAPGADRGEIGVAVEHPAGRGRGRGAQHDLEPGRAQRVDRPIHPVEPEVTGAGLDARPGELADANAPDAGPAPCAPRPRPRAPPASARGNSRLQGCVSRAPPRPHRRFPSSTHMVSGNDQGTVGPWSVSHAPGASMASRPSAGVARERGGMSSALTSRTR